MTKIDNKNGKKFFILIIVVMMIISNTARATLSQDNISYNPTALALGTILTGAITTGLILINRHRHADTCNTYQQIQRNAMQDFIDAYYANSCSAGVCWYGKRDQSENLGWWNTANLVEILTNYIVLYPTEIQSIQPYIDQEHQNNPPSFINSGGYNDDRLWWLLAYLRVYEIYKQDQIEDYQKYLADAVSIFDNIKNEWDDTYCDGGVWWAKGGTKNYKNAITNELFFTAAASLAKIYYENSKLNKAKSYLSWAKKEYAWFTEPHGGQNIIKPGYYIEDGFHVINSTCKLDGTTVWTYNQGVILGGLIKFSYLERVLDNNKSLSKDAYLLAINIANSAINSENLTKYNRDQNRILVEGACEYSVMCNNNEMQFKGIFIRYLNYLVQYLRDNDPNKTKLELFIKNNANSVITYNFNGGAHFGLHWIGPYATSTDNAYTNMAALDLLLSLSPEDCL